MTPNDPNEVAYLVLISQVYATPDSKINNAQNKQNTNEVVSPTSQPVSSVTEQPVAAVAQTTSTSSQPVPHGQNDNIYDKGKIQASEEKYSLQEQGFLDAFEECMRAKYYVCEALFNNEVDRKKDGWDKADKIVKDLEPAIIAKTQPSMWALLGITAANLITSYITEIRDSNAQTQAGNFIEVFKGSSFIDKKLVQEIAQRMIIRFRDQINQLTVSTRDRQEIILDAKDGVVILARRITARITLHVMRDQDKTYRAGKEDKLLSPVERCLNALYKCSNDGLSKKEYLPRLKKFEQRDEERDRWDVVSLLERTGLKSHADSRLYTCQGLVDDARRFVGRKEITSLHESYGFCYTSHLEITDRSFIYDPAAVDPFTNINRRKQLKVKASSFSSAVTPNPSRAVLTATTSFNTFHPPSQLPAARQEPQPEVHVRVEDVPIPESNKHDDHQPLLQKNKRSKCCVIS